MGRELHVHTHESGIERLRHLIEIIALIAAAVWAVYVFVYQERIKPQSELPRFQPTVTLVREPITSEKEFVEVKFDLRNTSAVPVSLTGLVVNVFGRRFADRSSERIESPLGGVTELNRTLVASPQTLLYSYYDTWQAFGAPEGKVADLPPGRDFIESFAFAIKHGSFHVARVTYAFCYSRPGDASWRVYRRRTVDGAYAFGGLDRAKPPPGLFCAGQRRGEFFPL